MSSKLEELLNEVGDPGRQQIIATTMLIILATYAISANHLLSLITLTPPHHCRLSNESTWINESIPYVEETYDSCYMYQDPSNHSLGVKECADGYSFHFQDGDRTTVSTEWELVCENKYLVRIYQTMYFAGVTTGGLLFGYLADKYGRLTITVAASVGQLILGIAVAFAKTFEASCALIFIRGLFLQGVSVSTIILITEIFSNKYRAKVTSLTFSVPALMMAFVVIYNYPIANWRYQVLAHTLTSAVLLIAILIYGKESIRWLLSQNKIEKAYEVAISTAKFNRLPVPSNLDSRLKEIVDEIQSQIKTKKKQTLVDVMRYPHLRNMCLIQFFGIIAAQMSVYGFSFLIGEIGGNIHVTFTLASFGELGFRIFGYFMIENWGRRTTSVIVFSVMSFSNLIFTIAQHFKSVHPAIEIFSLVIAIIGRVFNGLYFVSAMIMCTELSPTTVRSSIFGALNTCGRFGLSCLPFLLLLGDYVWKQLPFVIFGIFALLSAIFFSFLPETKGLIIPNTIEEVLHLKRHKAKTNKKDSAVSPAPDITFPMLNAEFQNGP